METIIQGRNVADADVEFVQELLQSNPAWSRTRLSQELCLRWDWRNQKGELKDIACRSFLRKLDERGFIALPASKHMSRSARKQTKLLARGAGLPHATESIAGDLRSVLPVTVMTVDRSHHPLYRCLLDQYHYLGYHSVGQNMKYIVLDQKGTPLSCLLFGSAAWSSAPRDKYIGWSQKTRKTRVNWGISVFCEIPLGDQQHSLFNPPLGKGAPLGQLHLRPCG